MPNIMPDASCLVPDGRPVPSSRLGAPAARAGLPCLESVRHRRPEVPMAHPRPFRFAVHTSDAPDGATWTSEARRYEDLGFSTLLLRDHFDDQLAPIAAMTAAAAATTTLRVGCLVFDNDYRHPLVLAKEMATIDVLSGGRVDVGIGAGWMAPDYEQAGMPFDPPGTRVSRMIEAVAGHEGPVRRRPVRLRGRALHDHRARRAAEAGAAPAPADHDRRGRRAAAALRGARGRHHRHQPGEAQQRGVGRPERRRRDRRGDRPQDRLDPRGGRRALRRPRALDRRAVRRRSPTTGSGSPSRSPAGSTRATDVDDRPRRGAVEPVRAARHRRRDRRDARASAATAGSSRTTCATTTPSRRWRRSSPA